MLYSWISELTRFWIFHSRNFFSIFFFCNFVCFSHYCFDINQIVVKKISSVLFRFYRYDSHLTKRIFFILFHDSSELLFCFWNAKKKRAERVFLLFCFQRSYFRFLLLPFSNFCFENEWKDFFVAAFERHSRIQNQMNVSTMPAYARLTKQIQPEYYKTWIGRCSSSTDARTHACGCSDMCTVWFNRCRHRYRMQC